MKAMNMTEEAGYSLVKTSVDNRSPFKDMETHKVGYFAYYNNDVPVRLRATRNLHDPKYHMLFNLDPLVGEMTGSCVSPESKQTWTRLLDRLRINGLIDYWLDSRFHEVAAIELEKVDWTRFPDHERDEYEKSVLWLKAKRQFMSLAAAVRQSIIKLFVKR